MTDLVLAAFTTIFVLALLGAEAIGRALARRPDRQGGDPQLDKDRTGHVLTSIFGLLALLIGFSFAIALNRYESRRADVVAEANAIGSAHYRAGFLSAQGPRLQAELERYARHRVRYGQAGQSARPRLESEAAKLRSGIAAAGRRLDPAANTPLGALVVAGLTDVLDLGVQREANIRAKLPWTVFVVLVGLSFVGAGMMGYAFPSDGVSRQGASLFLFTLLALTIIIIVDLDRPVGGGTTIDQAPMLDLVRELEDSRRPPSGSSGSQGAGPEIG